MAGESVDAKVVLEAVDNFHKTFSDFINGMGRGVSAAENMQQALKSLDAGPALQKVAAAGQGIAQSQEKVAGAATTAKTKFTAAQDQMRDASGRFVAGAVADQKRHQSSTSSWAQIIQGIYERVGHVMVDAMLRGARAVKDFVVDGVKLAGDFEVGMKKIESAAGTSLAEAGLTMDQVKKKALELGQKTQFSAAQAQEAFLELVKGGVPVATAFGEATQATLDLAAAADVELGPAAEYIAKQFDAWHAKGVTATDIANVMSQTAQASSVNVNDLALGLYNAGGAASGMGMSFADVNRAIALVVSGFSGGAEAGTGFKSMLVAMTKPSKAARTAMKELGLVTKEGNSVFFDAQGSYKGLENTASELEKAFAGLSEQQKAVYASTIFGTYGMNAALKLIEKGSAGVRGITGDMAKLGSAQDQAKKRQEGWNYAVEQLNGTMETLKIVAITPLINLLTVLVNTAILPAANGMLDLANKFAAANPSFKGVENVILNVMSVFKNLFAIFGGGGISSIHGLQFALETFMPKDTAAKVSLFVGQVVSGIQKVVGWVTANWPTVLATINTVLAAVGGAVDTYVMPFVTALLSIVGQLVGFFVANLPEISAVAGSVFGAIAGFITTMIIPNVLFVIGIFQKLVEFVSTNLPLLVAVQQKWSQDTQNALKSVAPVLQVLGALFQTAFDLVKTIITTFVDVVLALFKAGMQLFIGDTEGALGTVNQVFSDKFEMVKTFLRNLVPQIVTLGQNIITGLLNGLKSAGNQIYDYLVGVVNNAVQGVKNLLNIHSPSKLMSWYGEMTMTGFADGIWSMREQVADAMRGVIENAIDSAGALMGEMAGMATQGDLGSTLGEMAADGIGGTGTGAIGGALGGAGVPTQVNVVVDGQPIARAIVRHGAAPIQNNNRRRYGGGGGGGGRGINRNQ